MKFNSYLSSHRVPEWRSAYINYRALKKIIKQCSQLPPTGEPGSSERDTDDGEPGGDEADESESERQEAEHAADTSISPPISDGHDLPGAGDVSSEPDTIDVKDSPPKLSTSQSMLRRRASVQSGSSIRSRASARRAEANKRPRGLTASLRRAGGWRFPPSTPLNRILPQLNENERKFFTTMVRELDKVEAFYAEREDHAVARFRDIAEQLEELDRHRRANELAKGRTESHLVPTAVMNAMPDAVVNSANRARRYMSHTEGTPRPSSQSARDDLPKNTLGEPQLDHLDDLVRHVRPETYARAKKALKAAVFEEYRYLGMLKSYRTLNRQGFSKALKKFEKNTRIPCSSSFMQRVNESRFVSSTKLDELTGQAEQTFADYFEGGSRKRALTRLRMLGQKKTHHFSAGRAGIWLGAAAPAIIDGIVKSCQASTRERIPYWPALLQLFGALLLPVALACALMGNLGVWHRARINWPLIFEFDVRTMMDWHQYLELPAMLLFLLAYAFWFSISDFWPDSISPVAWPLAWVVTTVVILFNPFPIMHLHARYWFIARFGQVLTAGAAPSVPTTFPLFWLGDLLTSCYYTFYNLGFFVCAYHRNFDGVPPQCDTNSTWASPALAMVPAFCRFGQSIRRYIDSDYNPVHALNAGKYATTCIYYWVYFNWRIRGSGTNGNMAIFILVAIANSTYSTIWDYKLDWNLLNLRSKNLLLRNDLVYKNAQWSYYLAIVVNFLLRFSWVIYLAPAPSVALRGFLVGLTEVFRRFVWNYFRLESEQVGNADSFRVTRDVPLPFAVEKRQEDEQDEAMADGSLSAWALHPIARLGNAIMGMKPASDFVSGIDKQEAGSPTVPRRTGAKAGDSSGTDDTQTGDDSYDEEAATTKPKRAV